LIFDEVITGFRMAAGGGQQYYGVTPDLATFAKAIGAGLPLSALGGRAEYMDWIADGRVVHAGTLNGNPLSLAAAAAAMKTLAAPNTYEQLWKKGDALRDGIVSILRSGGLTVQAAGGGSCISDFVPGASGDRVSRYTHCRQNALFGFRHVVARRGDTSAPGWPLVHQYGTHGRGH
jgi:glutamate-1-semialdehyde 2,1-aminomutase